MQDVPGHALQMWCRSPGSAPAGPALSALALEIRIQEVAVRGTALHGAVLGDGCPEASTRDVATRSRDVPPQSFMVLIGMLEGVAKLFVSVNLHGFTVSVYCVPCFLHGDEATLLSGLVP